MLQKKYSREFARAIHKATLVVMLPLSLAAGASALAQETTPPSEPPAATASVETSAQETQYLTEGATLTVLPETEIPLDTLEARYPFLKPLLADVREYNEEIKDNPTRVYISRVRDQEKNIDIFFASVQGPITCGASQCQMNVFVNDGSGYKQASAGAAPLPATLVKKDGEISMYFCSGEMGRAQLVLTPDGFEHKGNVISPQSGPPCRFN